MGSNNEMVTAVETLGMYDIGSVKEIVPISPDQMTLVYRIDASSGAYCLKQCRPIDGFQAELHRYFVARGWAPVLVADRNGDEQCILNGTQWSLSHFIDSDPPFNWTQPEWSLEQCFAAGAALATWQKFGTKFMRERGAGDTVHSASSPDQLPLVLNHGDFHPGNLLFRGKEVCAVLDYEYARMHSPLYDLGYAIVMFAGRWEPRHDGTIDENLTEALVDGYASQWAKSGQSEDLAIATAARDEKKVFRYKVIACYLLLYWLLDKYPGAENQRHFIARTLEHTRKMLLHLRGSTICG
jgi:Ser/Thr protein kinase RdoA (MazF antagonist)